MKKIAILFLLVIGMIFLGGCSLSGTQNSTTGTSVNQSSKQVPSAESGTINIQNFVFNPATLTVKRGATVTWTNNDSVPHQIKSANFNSDQINKGQSFSFTFNNAGIFDYSCAIHPSMLGKIIVE